MDIKDDGVLAAIFTARIESAQSTEEQAAADALTERKKNIRWIASNSQKQGSFLWFCDLFDLEPDAVRRELRK